MASELKRRTAEVLKEFIDMGDHWAEKVVAVNADGTPIGGGGGEGGGLTDAELRAAAVVVDVTDDGARILGVVSLDAATLAALENTAVTTGSERAEDSGHTTGDVGTFMMAVRNEGLANAAGSNLDYSFIAVDSMGRIMPSWQAPPGAGPGAAPFRASGTGDTVALIGAARRDTDLSYASNGGVAELHVDNLNRLKVKNIKDAQIVAGTLTIPNAGTLSTTGGDTNNGVIDLTKKSLVGIQTPAAWSTAALTFQGSMDGGITYVDLYDDAGTERSIPVTASKAFTVDPTKFMGLTHLKFRSGTSAAPVAQGAARILNYTTIAL